MSMQHSKLRARFRPSLRAERRTAVRTKHHFAALGPMTAFGEPPPHVLGDPHQMISGLGQLSPIGSHYPNHVHPAVQ